MSGISFVSPGLAAAAAASVVLPVLIHLLLRRRRAPVEWAAMELLREAIRRVQRRRRVERILLLSIRCATIACAGMAIAGPFLGDAPGPDGRRPRTLVAVIDDGAASTEAVDGGTAFGRSVDTVRTEIESLHDGDRVAVVPASLAATMHAGPASLDRRAALDRLRAAKPVQASVDLPAALALAGRIASFRESDGTDRSILLASAFRAGTVGAMGPMQRIPSDGIPIVATRPPRVTGPNVRVARIEADRRPGSGESAPRAAAVTLERDRGDGPLSTTVRLSGPSLTVPVERRVELEAGERSRTVRIQFSERTGGDGSAQRAVGAAIDGDAQPADDAGYTVLPREQRVRVAVIDRRSFDPDAGIDRLSPGDWVSRALSPGDGAPVEVIGVDPAALDARSLAAVDAAVMLQPRQATDRQWGMLREFVGRGGTLAVTPSGSDGPQPWTDGFATAFGVPWRFGIEAADIDPPITLSDERSPGSVLSAIEGEIGQLAPAVQAFRVLKVDPSPDVRAVQVSFGDGTPFLLTWRPVDAAGSVTVFTAAMDIAWTSLPLKPFMVPLWQEVIAEGRRRSSEGMNLVAGRPGSVPLPGVTDLIAVGTDGRRIDGARAMSVGAGGAVMGPPVDPGLYEALDASGTVRGLVAVNPDRSACSVDPVDVSRIEAWISQAAPFAWDTDGTTARDGDAPGQGMTRAGASPRASFAVPLLAAALLLAVVESIMARAFSRSVGSPGNTRA